MRQEIVAAIKARLADQCNFSKVCGLGFRAKGQGALCRVWCQGTPNSNVEEQPSHVELIIPLQIETVLPVNGDGDSDESDLYALVDAVFLAMQQYKLPGRGSEPIKVRDYPGMKEWSADGGPAIYTMHALIRVYPHNFSLT